MLSSLRYFFSRVPYSTPFQRRRRLWGSEVHLYLWRQCCFSDCLSCWCHRLPTLLVNSKRMWILSAAVSLSQPQLDLTWLSSSLHVAWKMKIQKRDVYLFISLKSCMRTIAEFDCGSLCPWVNIECRMPEDCCHGHGVPATNRDFYFFFSFILDFGLSAKAC